MSGSSAAAAKQDTNQFKKDGRGSTGNTSRDEKRSSDGSFSNQGRQNRGQGHHGSDNQSGRDRSGNRNDSRQYDKHVQETKSIDKEEKVSAEQPGAAPGEKKFTGRCRLFVGNLTPDMTEDEFRKMFEAYGEVSEVYANTSRGFGFIRLDYRHNAEAAKAALDGMQRKGRVLRVRFATHGAALKVKNLHPYVSNELLEQSFSQFGELERCVVIVDDRGKSTGEGIVEFVRKPGANSALRRITEGVFLMGIEPKPICVEPLEHKDEEDGLPEKFLTRNEQYKKEREKEPRFAPPGTFEYEFGMRWKQLEEVERQRIEQAKKDTEESRLKLEDEMQNALYDYQADQIRQELVRQQEELRRLEELRNQDRMRRQQEYDIRHQQEERERAQQEERRRADAMMMMRQQDIARGRGSLDMMKGRDEIMMGDRYGDRMPDHMTDRMGDRMSDRMPPGPSGYPSAMWDDKQRADVGMRSDAGRGRGPGSQPLQSPPQPPSSAGSIERGGPIATPAGGAAQGGAKTSPKPLMAASFGNIGNTSTGTSSNNALNASDGSSMEDDWNDEVDTSNFEDAEEVNEPSVAELGKTEVCLATFRSPDITNGGKVPPEICQSHAPESCTHELESETCSTDGLMHVDIVSDVSFNSTHDVKEPSKLSGKESCFESSNTTFGSLEHSMSDCDIDHEDIASSKQPVNSELVISHNKSDVSSSNIHTDIDINANPHNKQFTFQKSNSPMKVLPVDSSCCGIKSLNTHFLKDIATSRNVEAEEKCASEIAHRDDVVLHDGIDLLNTNHHNVDNKASETNSELPSDISNNSIHVEGNTSRQITRTKTPCPEDHSQKSLAINSQFTTTNSSSDLPSQYSVNSESSNAGTLSLASQPHSSSLNSSSVNVITDITNSNCQESDYSTIDTHVSESSPLNQNLPHDFCQQLHPSEKDNIQSDTSSSDINQYSNEASLIEKDSNQIQVYEQFTDNDEQLYGQHICTETEAMEVESVVDDDLRCGSEASGTYQSYEEEAANYLDATSELLEVPEIAQCDTSEGITTEVNLANDNSATPSDSTACDVESTNSESIEAVAETIVADGTSSIDDPATTSSSTSPSLSTKQVPSNSEDQEEIIFSQGDHTFMSASSRQASSVPFLQPGCPLPYVTGMNPSMYAGAAMVQGMGGPTVMTSSSVHIAQHPGGATIMQQRHMSTGINGGMAQATIMQQQAMPNGLQATSVMQRTLTNGGQTMVVQQRTMTTGLDGVTQQTVVQQQVAAPSMAQAAMYHHNAIRQRTLAAQQASMMQQRGIRLVQTGVMGNHLVHTQPMGGATLIQGGTMGAPTAFVGHGLLRGVNQGTMMQQIVRQRYLGGPVMPGRGVQLMAGRPIRVKMTYPRESMSMDT